MPSDDFPIERRIVIGLITSDTYIQQVRKVIDPQLLESRMAQRLAGWCLEYYDRYRKAPGQEIESIYYHRLKSEIIPPEVAEDIEMTLSGMSQEYEAMDLNVDYLRDRTVEHLKERHLIRFGEEIKDLITEGKITDAEHLACNYRILTDESAALDMNSEAMLERMERAMTESRECILEYPAQLGTFWNDQMVRDGFVAFLAPEKRGKSYFLMDAAVRAAGQGRTVAYFQAGDMTENQWLQRLGIHLTGKSDREEYSGEMFEPVRDCINNQLGTCDKRVRECTFGVFEGWDEKKLNGEISLKELIKAWQDNPSYRPCHNCTKYELARTGSVWIQKTNKGHPLTVREALKAASDFFIKHERRMKFSSYPNYTLTVSAMDATLDIWERQDNFVPEIIVLDYADLLAAERRMDFRHEQNEIWQRLRGMSQRRHVLLLTASLSDASSYEQDTLRLKNFSEDKRKYAHVTAFFGLNQDRKGREKEIGIMRINKILLRDADYNPKDEVVVLMNLRVGRPYIASFFRKKE